MSVTRDIHISFSDAPAHLLKELADLVIGHLNYQLKSVLHFHDGKFGDPIVDMSKRNDKNMGCASVRITAQMPDGFYDNNDVFSFAIDFLEVFFDNLLHTVLTGSPVRGDGTRLIEATHQFSKTLIKPVEVHTSTRPNDLNLALFRNKVEQQICPVGEDENTEAVESVTADSTFAADIQALFDKHTQELRDAHAKEIAKLKEQLEVKTQEASQLYDILSNRKAVGL